MLNPDHKLTFGVVHEIVVEHKQKCNKKKIEITLNINNFHTGSDYVIKEKKKH
jgi:hypothetical protein